MLSRIGFSTNTSTSKKKSNESNFEDDSVSNDIILHELLMTNNYGDEYSQSVSSVSTNTLSHSKQTPTIPTISKSSKQVQDRTNATTKNKKRSDKKYNNGTNGIQEYTSKFSPPHITQNRTAISKQKSSSSKFSSFPNQQHSSKKMSTTSSMSSSSASANGVSAFRDGHFELLKSVPSHNETTYSNDKKSVKSYSRNNGITSMSSASETQTWGEPSNFSNHDATSKRKQHQQHLHHQLSLHRNQSHSNSDGSTYNRYADNTFNNMNISINQSNRQRYQNNQTETEELYDNNDINDLDMLLRIFGEPYSNQISFWIQIIPSVIFLGVLIGFGSLLFLFSYKTFFFYWVYYSNDDDDEYDDDYDDSLTTISNATNATFLLKKGSWWWLWMTTLGQFFAACFLLFPNAPSLGEAKTFFHDAVTLQVCSILLEHFEWSSLHNDIIFTKTDDVLVIFND